MEKKRLLSLTGKKEKKSNKVLEPVSLPESAEKLIEEKGITVVPEPVQYDNIEIEIPIPDEAKIEIEKKKEEIKTAIFGVIRKVSKLSIKHKDYKEDFEYIKKKCAWIKKNNRCHTCLLYRSECLFFDKW